MLLRALASAGETASSVASQASEAVTAGLNDAASQMGSMIVKVVPIGLGIVAAIMVITFGIKLFKKVTNKG